MMERTQSFFLKEPNSNDKIRIFCFPYAGGGASAYRNWGTYLPNYVGVYPIQIPGRENRITEKALTDMCKLTDKIVSAIHPYLDTPYLVFGHSLSTWKDSVYERINYQGKPMSDEDQVIIVDDDGKEQPYGIEGEILVKGPYLFSGYYEMDSSECFNADGFYHTGDLGYITADGYIKITGRKSDQINRMGEKIMPSEIESYLAEHEKIMEVVVMGIPDTILGERSCAFLRMAKGNVKPEELREHLSKKGVAQYKVPDQMILLDEFPHTATGKINKRMLLTMANKYERRYNDEQ